MTRYLEQLNETTDPTTGDYLPIYDASAGSTDKDRKVNISRFAILANAQSFTTTQTFAPTSTSVAGVAVNAPASCSVPIHTWSYNATRRSYIVATSTSSNLALDFGDFGSLVAGPSVIIGGNNNATNACSGTLNIYDRAGTARYLWPDQSGIWRTYTAAPTNFTTDTGSSTIVGSQSSSLDSKDVIGEFTDYDGALAEILNAPLYDFTYKSGAFNGEKFTGIITDYSPAFGMDRDDAHPAGKSLNPITSHGYEMAAIKALYQRLVSLEERIR